MTQILNCWMCYGLVAVAVELAVPNLVTADPVAAAVATVANLRP